MALPACQQPRAPDELRGKSMVEACAIIGEPLQIRCCPGAARTQTTQPANKHQPRATGSTPSATAIWYYSDGYIAFGPDYRVVEYTPGIRRCEVRFQKGATKEDVRGVIGSPGRIAVLSEHGDHAITDRWCYPDGYVNFDAKGRVVEQYGRLVQASGPLQPLPVTPPNWDKLSRGMTADEVHSLLGNAVKRTNCLMEGSTDPFAYDYQYAEGRVRVDARTGVNSWSFPSQSE